VTDETSDAGFTGKIDGLEDLDLSGPSGESMDLDEHEPIDPDADMDADVDADPDDQDLGDRLGGTVEPDLEPEDAHAIAEAQRAMEEARARLADVPAEVVVTNHVMGLYELAAIHLSASPPDLRQAALAIDSVACLVDGLGDRLGPEAPTMRDALNNIRIAFVQIKGTAED
jgi:hypothetical protein